MICIAEGGGAPWGGAGVRKPDSPGGPREPECGSPTLPKNEELPVRVRVNVRQPLTGKVLTLNDYVLLA